MKNLFKKIILTLIFMVSIFSLSSMIYASSTYDQYVTKDTMIVWWGWDKNLLEMIFGTNKWWADLDLWVDGSNVSIKDNFLKTAVNYLLWLVAVVAITMFIYIWFQLATAEGKDDQFKKAMKALVYLAVWLAVIPLSFVVIKITTWFTF